MRPAYESITQRAAEQEFAEQLARTLGLTLHRLPRGAPLDYASIVETPTGGVRATGLLELKIRHIPSTKHDSFFLSAKKIASARDFWAGLRLPADLYVQWSDGRVGRLHLHDTPPDYTTIGGRLDRDDPQDIELMAHWYIRRFHFLTP
jgi:hypothetical protein